MLFKRRHRLHGPFALYGGRIDPGKGDEFVEALTQLVGDPRLRAAMGANGRAYVRKNHRWDVIISKYERMFTKLRAR